MDKPIIEMRHRLKKAMSYRSITPIELSEATNIPKSSISQYMSGYAKPKQDRIFLICEALGINEAWLLGYDVPMKRNESGNNPLLKAALKSDPDRSDDLTNALINSHLTEGIDFEPIDIELLAEFKKLNSYGKNEAVNRVTELTYIPQYIDTNIISLEKTKEVQNKKYEPTEEDIKSLVARNGKKLTREEAIDLITTLFSDDEDDEQM